MTRSRNASNMTLPVSGHDRDLCLGELGDLVGDTSRSSLSTSLDFGVSAVDPESLRV